MLAFAYILAVVIVALEVPLAVNLHGRAEAELTARALVQAQSFASALTGRVADTPALREDVRNAADQAEGRVTVVDATGVVVADSESDAAIGTDYRTPGRPEIGRALANDPTSEVRTSEELGQDILATAVPIAGAGGTPEGAVRITQSTAGANRNANRAVIGLVAIGIAGLVAGLVLAYLLAGSLSRPLRRLADAARRLGAGDLSARTDTRGGGREIDELARSFDDMAERLEGTVRAQREFAANASHQLRTPLAGMKLRLESAAAADLPDAARRHVEAAEAEVDRLAGVIDRLLSTARRAEAAEPEAVDLAAAAGAAVERWRDRAARAGARIDRRGPGASARAARADVDQILDNLIDNALSHGAPPVVIEVARSPEGGALLAVEDGGAGVADAERERLTDRFYRGSGSTPGGSGLGLAIVRELADGAGGGLRLGRAAAGGLRAEVRLPGADP
ncbi:MAG: ATP-binding protein [Thermoleophilia bacterium]